MNAKRVVQVIKEMMAVGTGGFTGSSPAEGPTAGFDPMLCYRNRKRRIRLIIVESQNHTKHG